MTATQPNATRRALLVEDTIDNTQVVRWRDARLRSDLVWLAGILLALALVFVVYGWPRAQLRLAGSSAGKLQREKERLTEENRQLRLERAALEDLRRVESIARDHLGLVRPKPERVIVVDRPGAARSDARVAESAPTPKGGRP